MPSISTTELQSLHDIPEVNHVGYEEPLLTIDLQGTTYSIQIPDHYPTAPAEYYGPTHGTLRPGSVRAMVLELLSLADSVPGRFTGEADREDSTGGGMLGDTHDSSTATDFSGGGGGGSRQNSNLFAVTSDQVSPEWEHDLARLRMRSDISSVVVSSISGKTFVRWLMSVGDVISVSVAKAWGIDTQAPIEVVFTCWVHYLDATSPATVEFFQNGQRFPYGQQMSRILNTYLSRHWSRSFPTASMLREKMTRTAGMDPLRTRAATDAAAAAAVGSQHGRGTAVSASQLSRKQIPLVNQLMTMGYEHRLAVAASLRSETIEQAVNLLCTGSITLRDTPEADSPPAAAAAAVPQPSSDSTAATSLILDPSATKYEEATDVCKHVAFRPEDGLLSHVVDVVLKRTPTLSKYCVLCDRPHVFSSHMLRPAVCSREICVFQFQEFKIGSDAAESIATDAGVVDLLLTIFRCAANSPRAAQILLPFPAVPDPRNPKKLALDPQKPDVNVVKRILAKFPTTKDVVRCDDLLVLKSRLESVEPLAYPLLEWVIASNRSHLILLDPKSLLPSMDTQHQFLLLTAPPEKELVFREKKAKHKTKFAFHGSRIENWHSILRNGLKNMSGTALQVNGAAHGSGIYFANVAGTSMGYSGGTPGTGGSATVASADFFSESMICLALCEIVDDGCIKDHGWCWTVEEEANVMTRFLFAYMSPPSQKAGSANTTSSEFMTEVRRAMSFYSL